MADHLHIITGGPGSGKTTLIHALAAGGIRHMPEAGRAIIQDQVDIGGTALPWNDREAFAALMLAWEMRSHREAVNAPGPIVFDRGIPDVIGYLRLCGLPVPAATLRAAELRRYARRVFIAPPWPAIFAQDAERRQTLAEAETTYHAMIATYSGMGYELVTLPLASIDERAQFVRERIG
ncbi:AAA family ATPase [Sphingomonas sp. H39-1-10]|uniref:AAA family ATPase n=1 Tax=Sphingomonas TaxID=13687 RepID=UPI00087F673A|nr:MULTISPECIES: AAA family ATPase [Sphingomonas]MDF0487591.1 AAA family ATPase [Sphingomonas pollutisoli]SDA16842.1 Predicted ATPase [Sphingomonas sp. NFR15]